MNDRHQKPSYPLRMPDDLRAELDSAAKANNRSLNAEIVARLEESFEPSGDANALNLAARLQVELAQAKYAAHRTTVEMQNLGDTLHDLLKEIDERGLTTELSSAVTGFDALEPLTHKPRVRDSFLAQEAARLEAELVAAKKSMDEALVRLDGSRTLDGSWTLGGDEMPEKE